MERYQERDARLRAFYPSPDDATSVFGPAPRRVGERDRAEFGDLMDVFELTRKLIDIDSVTGRERAVGEFLLEHLGTLAERTGGQVESMPVEADRFNVLAAWGEPRVTLSTHMDVVPPWFTSSEDEDFIYGRGACDAKGILAAMIAALERLLGEGVRDVALLVLVGEERNSAGALEAARRGRGARYLINGEPTENRLALGSKGALRYELTARGRMAHSAFPELGESAIHKLLDALEAIRRIPLAEDPVLGAGSLNVGTISGGRAPNVIADEARAEAMFRLVTEAGPLREAVERAMAGRAEAREVLMVPPVWLRALEGFETTVVPFTTDIPPLAGAWGEPFLIGPGSARFAHTLEERVSKRELVEAVDIYCRMVRKLHAEKD